MNSCLGQIRTSLTIRSIAIIVSIGSFLTLVGGCGVSTRGRETALKPVQEILGKAEPSSPAETRSDPPVEAASPSTEALPTQPDSPQELDTVPTVASGDYVIASCTAWGIPFSPKNAFLHLNPAGDGYFHIWGVDYTIQWQQDQNRFSYATDTGLVFSGTCAHDEIQGTFADFYTFTFSHSDEDIAMQVAELATRPPIDWSQLEAAGTVIEDFDAEGNYHFYCPEGCTPQDILIYFCWKYNLSEENFACSFYSPLTGEFCAFNDTAFMKAASTYKLPLNMYYYDHQALGVYTGDTYVGGTTLDNAHYLSMVWSDNEISEEMIYYIGSFYDYKLFLNERYGQLSDQELDSIYWEGNYYNTRFMMNTLTWLFGHMSSYPELLEYMMEACPDDYLDLYAGDTIVAHKEGYFEGHIHDVGITFTDNPFLIAVFTQNLPDDNYAMRS